MSLPSFVRFEAPHASDGSAPQISVVIPAYNEAERITPYLDAIDDYFSKRGESWEVLVADDGSKDGTANLIRQRMATRKSLGLIHYDQNRGKGHAVRMGMLAARGALRLFADADGSTPIAELERLRTKIEKDGFDLAVGSRALRSPEVQRKIKPHRFVIGQAFRLIRQFLLNVRVVDSQCGFKLFTASAARVIFEASKVDGFAFDVEVLYLAARCGLKPAEVPVNWHDSRASRVNLLTDPPKMVLDMLRIRQLHRHTELPADVRKETAA